MTVSDKHASPAGQLDKAEITLRLVLPRAALERLTVRAMQEQRKLEALIQEILEAADDLTHREFTADLAALVESTAAKDGALVASQFESGPGAELYRPHEFSSCYSRAATLGSSPIWDPPVLGARFHSAV
jgi:hypothetical protein